MKKAQANTFWIVIGAVIALIVLVVLLLMFTGKTNILEQGLADCEAKQGICVAGTSCDKGYVKQSFFECGKTSAAPGGMCCIGSASSED